MIGAVLLLCIPSQADIQTTTASSSFYDLFGQTGYATTVQLAPFDTRLGTLTSVDLTVSANFNEAFWWEPLVQHIDTGMLGRTVTGTASLLQPTIKSWLFDPCCTNAGYGCPYCYFFAPLRFGGEATLDGTDLAQFESGPVTLSASTAVTFQSSRNIGCCVPVELLTYAPYPQLPGYTIPVYGYLTLDVTAALPAVVAMAHMTVLSLATSRSRQTKPAFSWMV